MAIQSRRGAYGDFDPDKMLPGEWASVLKDDPKAQDGKAVYMCFSAGDVKRMATYEDMKNNIQEATAEIIEQAKEEVKEDTKAAKESAAQAESSANTAEEKASAAEKSASNAEKSAEASKTALESANKNFSDQYTKKTYKKGETCIQNNVLYEANANIDTAEDWNAAHWTETSVEKIRAKMRQELDTVNTKIANKANVADTTNLMLWTGMLKDGVVGLEVDYRNGTFKRLSSADGLSQGKDFDSLSMYGGRRCCNVADDGTITAWYGDESYTEDGSNGQVMVYQPKFYYMVYPVETEPIDTGIGYHLRKANYYVSDKPRPGFKLHPAFYDAAGNEIEYFLTSAYEGSLYDVSAAAYLLNDEQIMNPVEDKLSSISGAKPASGLKQQLTREKAEQIAHNRGVNWHSALIKQVSAEQMLMIIELGTMNTQTGIAQGVVRIPNYGEHNCSSLTGSTVNLGNGTGRAAQTINTNGDSTTIETADDKTAIRWRGKENFWGNIWKFVYGINIWGNGKMGGGQPYVCNNFDFSENKNNGNYEKSGFTVTNTNGYISAMGYSPACDWLFMASECLGNNSLPVGDYVATTHDLNSYKIAILGGSWYNGADAGAFRYNLEGNVGSSLRTIGCRLIYVPTAGSDEYNAAIAFWKQQMAQVASE